MKSFKDIELKNVYSDKDEILEFYNSVLSKAAKYDRVSAYISDGIFNILSRGLNEFYINNGKIRMIISSEVDVETFRKIKEGYKLREKFSLLSKDFFNIEEEMIIYLIAAGALELKIAFMKKGIMHDKFALVYDDFSNTILFSGSNNETAAAIENNHESFDVTLNFDKPSYRELDKIRIRSSLFHRMWNNQTDGIYVTDIESIELSEFNGRINKERLSQILLNLDFLNIDLNSDGLMVINSNIPFDNIIKSEKIVIFKDLINVGKEIIFKERLSYTDSIYVVKQFKESCDILNLKFFLKDKLSTFLERNYFNPLIVASVGLNIKNTELSSNKDFQAFSDEINKSLKRPLRVPQLKSSYHFVKLKRVMNFSVPGSGKTASILGSFQYLKNNGLASRIIVFCPLNAFSAWRSEYMKVIPDSSESQILDISEVKDKNYAETYINNQFKRSRLVLINFERIKSIKDHLEGLFSNTDIVVYDEIHRLKKTDSEKVSICKSITKEANYRSALSGTPFPNGYQDLSNLLDLIFEDHASSYFGIDSKTLKHFDQGDPSKNRSITNFNTKIFPFYVRITKKDLEVPEVNEDKIIEIMFEGYDKVIELRKKSSNHLALIPKLIQYTSIPSLIYNKLSGEDLEQDHISDVLEKINEPVSNEKSSALLDLLFQNNRKTIVWCSYVNSILYLEKFLKSKGIKTYVIYGSTEQSERNRIIDEFNSNNKFEVLITNPNTLAESVSLHYNCHDAVYYEISYNLSFFLQSKDRIHRLGLAKDQKTNYYLLISLFDGGKYSLDRNILNSIIKKEAVLLNSIQNNIYVKIDEEINPLELEKML